MKKIAILVMLVTTVSTFAKGASEFSVIGSGNFNENKLGYGIGAEYEKTVKKSEKLDLKLGLGIKYDSYDNGDESSYATKVATLPVYLNAKAVYKNYYAKASVGYTNPLETDNSSLKDLKGGAYYGLGAGINRGNYSVGLNYDVANYEGNFDNSITKYSNKVQYGKVSLQLGYKF